MLIGLMACDQPAKKPKASIVDSATDTITKRVDKTKSVSNYSDEELEELIDNDTINLIPNYSDSKMVFFRIKKSLRCTKAFNEVLKEDRDISVEWARKYKDNWDNQYSVLDYLSEDRMSYFKKTMLDKNMKNGHTEFRNYALIKGRAVSLNFNDLFKENIFIAGLNYDYKSDSLLIGVPDELKVDCLNFGNLVKGNGPFTEVPQIEFAFHKDGIQIHFVPHVVDNGFYPTYKFIYEYENQVISYKLLKPYLRDDLVFLAN
ncbi:MAG TPA: hypothetical protein VGF79_10130 [Bacteroidia bacterium]